MRSYTNNNLEVVEVSEEHLITALTIKQALQSQSPSMKCSWAKHKKMMVQEGFDNSENSESYRQMIKKYQKSIGKLPTATQHAEMVKESQLESIQEMVGELAWQKREIQHETKKLGKVRRDVIDGSLFVQEVALAIKESMKDIDFSAIVKDASPAPLEPTQSRMIAVVSDWHIGALVHTEHNQYNLEIAKRRINDYVDQILRLAEAHDVWKIDVVYAGDILEHAYMRNSQAYHAEFPVSKQMTIAGRLMVEMVTKLSKKHVTSYRGFAGNHDRMNGDKNGNIDGDTGMIVVNDFVKQFTEVVDIPRLKYFDCKDYSAVIDNVNGRSFKFVHGDLEKKADTGKIKDHSFNDNANYDAIVYGHFHHYMALEVGIDKWEIRCGSTKGSDDYSEKLGLGSAPSQVAIIVTEKGEILPHRIRVN